MYYYSLLNFFFQLSEEKNAPSDNNISFLAKKEHKGNLLCVHKLV